eukprot:2770185-Amphidinium_carterae.1
MYYKKVSRLLWHGYDPNRLHAAKQSPSVAKLKFSKSSPEILKRLGLRSRGCEGGSTMMRSKGPVLQGAAYSITGLPDTTGL